VAAEDSRELAGRRPLGAFDDDVAVGDGRAGPADGQLDAHTFLLPPITAFPADIGGELSTSQENLCLCGSAALDVPLR